VARLPIGVNFGPKINTTPSTPNLLFIALMGTLAVWLITILTALIQGGAISATPIICWWVCWALACVAISDRDKLQAGGGQ
jgi:hypothetical protein